VTKPRELAPALPEDRSAVFALLADAGLPTEDLAVDLNGFEVARVDGELVGCAALEAAGDVGLLRSVAVATTRRSQGLGRALVDRCLEDAKSRGFREVYLLTTSAQGYFGGFGFQTVSREHAPSGIRATAEFASLCPSSAVLMRKVLAPS
jgi:amino-acid N-acetyltransferase